MRPYAAAIDIGEYLVRLTGCYCKVCRSCVYSRLHTTLFLRLPRVSLCVTLKPGEEALVNVKLYPSLFKLDK